MRKKILLGIILALAGFFVFSKFVLAGLVYQNDWNPNSSPLYCQVGGPGSCDEFYLNSPEPKSGAASGTLSRISVYLQTQNLDDYINWNCPIWWYGPAGCAYGDFGRVWAIANPWPGFEYNCLSDNQPMAPSFTPGVWQKFTFTFSNCKMDFGAGHQFSYLQREGGKPYGWAIGQTSLGGIYAEITSSAVELSIASPLSGAVFDESASLSVSGTCPVNGSAELALSTQNPANQDFQANYNVDCVDSAFNSTLSLSAADAKIYVIDKATGKIANVEIIVNQKIVPKTPVLIVPGITGTEIYKGTEKLWPDITRMLSTPGDTFMDPLAFDENGEAIDSSLSLGYVLREPVIKFFDYSEKLIKDFQSKGYILGKDLFLFPYDWRKSDHDSALISDPQQKNLSLKQIIDQILLSNGVEKIDIIAHSQGGLVVKRLLFELPEYQSKIDKLVFVGTPNLGAPNAAKALLYGDSIGVEFWGLGLDPQEIKKIGRNMPALYELLPSREYFNYTNGYLGKAEVLSGSQPILHVTTLNASDTPEYLKDQNLNANLVDAANLFHSSEFDNFDFSATGIKTFNIVGCQSGTPGKILAKANNHYQIMPVAGDGTVPFISANHIPGATTYFALKSNHGVMLTQDGIREQIVGLISDNNFTPKDNLTPSASDCHFNGQQIAVHSPVELHIYDERGNHAGPLPDGNIEVNIEGVAYNVIEHDKFAFLPPDHVYTIKFNATAEGNFSFDSLIIQAGQVVSTAHYASIPIASTSTAQVILNANNDQPIQFISDDRMIPPSAILDAGQSQDLASPNTALSVNAQQNASGEYQAPAVIMLTAEDPVIEGQKSQTSGIYKIFYNLDNAGFAEYLPSPPLSVSAAGAHTIEYYSVDRAGNAESAHGENFTVAVEDVSPAKPPVEPPTQPPLEPPAPLPEQAPAMGGGGGGGSYGIFYPANFSFTVNNNFATTGSVNVSLQISGGRIAKMLLANDKDFSEADWRDFSSSFSWRLSPDAGTKIVYARFKDQNGSLSPVYEAKIELTGAEIPVSQGQVLGAAVTGPAHPEGSLILGEGQTVYIILNNSKRPFFCKERFLALGFQFARVVPASDADGLLLLGLPL